MTVWGNVNFDGLKQLQEKLIKAANQDNIDAFCSECAKELAARFLADVIKNTPTRKSERALRIVRDSNNKIVRYKRNSKKHKAGEYKRRYKKVGGVGGTLKRGWTSETHKDAVNGNSMSIEDCLKSMKVEKYGRIYKIIIFNPVEYAWYVEYGHMKRNGKGWVKGYFMMTKAKNNIRNIKNSLLQSKLDFYLRKCFNG